MSSLYANACFLLILLYSLLLPLPVVSDTATQFVEFKLVLSNSGAYSVSDFVVTVSISDASWVGWAYYDQLNVSDPAVLCVDENGTALPIYVEEFVPHSSLRFKVRYTGTLGPSESATLYCYIGEKGYFIQHYNYTAISGKTKLGKLLFSGSELGKVYVYAANSHTIEQSASTGNPPPSLYIHRSIYTCGSAGGTYVKIILLDPIYLSYDESIYLSFDYKLDYYIYLGYTSRDPGLYVDVYTLQNDTTFKLVTYTEAYRFPHQGTGTSHGSVAWTTKTIQLASNNYNKIYIGFSVWWGYYSCEEDHMYLWLDNIFIYKTAPAVQSTLYGTTITSQIHGPPEEPSETTTTTTPGTGDATTTVAANTSNNIPVNINTDNRDWLLPALLLLIVFLAAALAATGRRGYRR